MNAEHDNPDYEYLETFDEPMLASFDAIKQIVEERQFQFFTWPDEPKSKIPLLIDMTTASMLVKVHSALDDEARQKFEEWVAKSRKHFAKLVVTGWRAIK